MIVESQKQWSRLHSVNGFIGQSGGIQISLLVYLHFGKPVRITTYLWKKYMTRFFLILSHTAKLINFLASEESDWITGQLINSEGGFLGK